MYGFRHLSKRATLNIKNCAGPQICAREEHPFKMRAKKIIEKQSTIIKNVNNENQHEIIADMVTPYWKISYEDELKIKQKMSEDAVEQIFLRTVTSKNKGQIERRVISDIIASPVRDAYRNKDEFSVWPGLDGNPKTVGFFVGSPAVGKVVCIPATKLKNIKESHKRIGQVYEDFIRSSPLPVSYQLFDGGFWRSIVVRSNDAGDHMAIVITNPGSFSPELIAEQETLLKDYFSEHVPLLSLYHQSCPHTRCTRDQAPFNHLSGQPYLTEHISNLTFRISPDSFFQQNKGAAELMYQEVLTLVKPKHYSTLLDLYCGVGAISLMASDTLRGCIGVDEVKTAMDDANYNAHSNNITNCSFLAGRVELKLPSLLKKLDYTSDIIAVVNPGRSGASESVISLLRRHRHIQKVIYVSCKPDNPLTMKNFVQLCEQVAPDSRPFYLTKAVPIDLFPYTSHYELILCFQRR